MDPHLAVVNLEHSKVPISREWKTAYGLFTHGSGAFSRGQVFLTPAWKGQDFWVSHLMHGRNGRSDNPSRHGKAIQLPH